MQQTDVVEPARRNRPQGRPRKNERPRHPMKRRTCPVGTRAATGRGPPSQCQVIIQEDYSPTGGEQGGTLPDRLDAIARNFFWLNVLKRRPKTGATTRMMDDEPTLRAR